VQVARASDRLPTNTRATQSIFVMNSSGGQHEL
jgi:hypothetical protein